MNLMQSSRIALLLLAVTLCAQSPSVRAEIVSTDQVAKQNTPASEREKVQAFMDRADVKQRLQAFGVGGLVAKDRVAALSDEEVHTLALKIDAVPAGGNLSNSDLMIILLVAILVAIVA